MPNPEGVNQYTTGMGAMTSGAKTRATWGRQTFELHQHGALAPHTHMITGHRGGAYPSGSRLNDVTAHDHPTIKSEDTVVEVTVVKGDTPGHEFHGNQWTEGGAHAGMNAYQVKSHLREMHGVPIPYDHEIRQANKEHRYLPNARMTDKDAIDQHLHKHGITDALTATKLSGLVKSEPNGIGASQSHSTAIRGYRTVEHGWKVSGTGGESGVGPAHSFMITHHNSNSILNKETTDHARSEAASLMSHLSAKGIVGATLQEHNYDTVIHVPMVQPIKKSSDVIVEIMKWEDSSGNDNHGRGFEAGSGHGHSGHAFVHGARSSPDKMTKDLQRHLTLKHGIAPLDKSPDNRDIADALRDQHESHHLGVPVYDGRAQKSADVIM